MAKTLRTSGDYTIKAGAGFNTGAGEHNITLDSRYVRITGDLTIDGEQTVVNTQTLSVEDAILVLNRNESSNATTGSDSGILINRGEAGVNAAFYWDESLNVFKAVTTSSGGSGALGTTITDLALVNLRIAEPSNNSDAATKYYVDNAIIGGGYSLFLTGDDSNTIQLSPAANLFVQGGRNITTAAIQEPDELRIDLDTALTDVNSVTSGSGQNLTLAANTSLVVVNNILTFASTASDPAGTPTYTKIYHKTIGGGDTGIYFKNPSGTVGELISKKKATALAIALG